MLKPPVTHSFLPNTENEDAAKTNPQPSQGVPGGADPEDEMKKKKKKKTKGGRKEVEGRLEGLEESSSEGEQEDAKSVKVCYSITSIVSAHLGMGGRGSV